MLSILTVIAEKIHVQCGHCLCFELGDIFDIIESQMVTFTSKLKESRAKSCHGNTNNWGAKFEVPSLKYLNPFFPEISSFCDFCVT